MKYTATIERELKKLFSEHFVGWEHDICILATGSFGKQQLTQNSDIDVFCIINDSVKDANRYKRIVKEKLSKMPSNHAFEYYPFVTLSEWKWIAEYSTLYCTDLFYAKPLFGDQNLYSELMTWINENNIDYKNRKSYIAYNLIYRQQQLANLRNDSSIKYQPGGLRDFQFLKWVSWRLAKNKSAIPTEYISALVKKGLISENDYIMVLDYVISLLEYKWYLEKDDKQKLEVVYKQYNQLKELFIPVLIKLKLNVIKSFSKQQEKPWQEYVLKAYSDVLSATHTKQAVENVASEESCICVATFMSQKPKQIEYFIARYQHYWSVRAAAAMNKFTSSAQLNELYDFNYPDMQDIKNFIKNNKNYKKNL